MARRIKEDPSIHRNRIAKAAERLFQKQGAASTTMDDVAIASGYSKATLYVYFQNKDDLVAYLAHQSMCLLKDAIVQGMGSAKTAKESFMNVAFALADYGERCPDYYRMTLQTIRFDEAREHDDFLHKTFVVGEEINRILLDGFERCQKNGELPQKTLTIADILQIWAMICGIIDMSRQKEQYIEQIAKKEKHEFLKEGFEKIYQTLQQKGTE